MMNETENQMPVFAPRDLDLALPAYLDHIMASYANQTANFTDCLSDSEADAVSLQYAKERIADFNNRIRVTRGSKYLKVSTNGGAHTFIALVDSGKFKVGDILKPVSWAAPALNFRRGSVLDPSTWGGVRWSGVS
jgi:hypothetical protein